MCDEIAADHTNVRSVCGGLLLRSPLDDLDNV